MQAHLQPQGRLIHALKTTHSDDLPEGAILPDMSTQNQRHERLWEHSIVEKRLPWTSGWGAGTSTTGPGAGLSEAPDGTGTMGAGLSERLGCGTAKGPKAAHISGQDCSFSTDEGVLGHVKAKLTRWSQGQQQSRN